MATTVHEPPKIDPRPSKASRATAAGGTSFRQTATCAWCRTTRRRRRQTGIWVVLYAITMIFAAFTSALIVRKGSSLDWQTLHVAVDPLPAIRCCSWPAASRWKSHAAAWLLSWADAKPGESPARWLYITWCLGLLFVAGQYVAWTQLRAKGFTWPPIQAVLSSMC